MQFTYENLWKTLEKNGMNKTDLRRRLGVSTATIAKLSGNQPVAMEVLGKMPIDPELAKMVEEEKFYEVENLYLKDAIEALV